MRKPFAWVDHAVIDTGGDFHAFWPDSRSGMFEIYTARITVSPTRR
jgi:hypothetical protein